MEHMLEHLPEPLTSLRHMAGMLHPGGLLALTLPAIHAWQPVQTLAGRLFLEYLQLTTV
jgi:2-polyprenyl-3-methyl-5-hydroxy-6-metoxy-1,4-benzoquinol methylase